MNHSAYPLNPNRRGATPATPTHESEDTVSEESESSSEDTLIKDLIPVFPFPIDTRVSVKFSGTTYFG